MDNGEKTLHIYTRVSSDAQADEGTSLVEQQKLGVRTAQNRGMKYVIWEEGAASSHNEGFSGRPQFLELLGLVEQGEIKHIFVSDLNRLSRNKNNSHLIQYKLASNKVTLHTTAGIYELGDPQSDLLFSMMSAFATYDNETRMERFRLGRFNRVSEGMWHGGAAPFGYKLENKRLVVNELTSKWVKFIYDEYAKGVSARDIRNSLVAQGVKTARGKDIWSIGSVEKILSNTHYNGSYKVVDSKASPPNEYDVSCPRILTESVFTQVQMLRKKRSISRVKNSNQKNTYLLKGLLKCGDCGRFFHGRVQDRQYNCYYCPSKERRWARGKEDDVQCNNSRYLRIIETDNLVWSTLLEVLRDSNQYKETIKMSVLGQPRESEGEIRRKKDCQSKLKMLKRQLKDYKSSLAKVETDLVLKQGDPEVLSQVKLNVENAIHSQCVSIKNLEMELEDLNKSSRWVDWVNKFGDNLIALENESVENRIEFLKGILSHISVETIDNQSHRLILHFHIPYVDDAIVWNDSSDKGKGYKIKSGLNMKEVCIDSSKKTYKIIQK